MNEQATAGWYPDGQGNERYWDGSAWTEHVRAPEASGATSAATSGAKKDGALSKFGASLKKAAVDKQAAKEELGRKHAEHAQAAGALVTSGVFGTSSIEIYSGGYVRVAAGKSDAERPASITKKAPYEKLRSIKCTLPVREGRAASSDVSGLMKGAAGLMKGGAGLMKASVPGLVVAGLSQVAAAEAGKSFLTIVTGDHIHTLTNQRHNGFMKTSDKGHNEVGLALEAAGNSVLSANGVEPHEPAAESQSWVVNQAAAGPAIGERFRELADLHKDGILSDDEFAAAKAKLLGGL